jgi:hypothetical protein
VITEEAETTNEKAGEKAKPPAKKPPKRGAPAATVKPQARPADGA